MNWDLVKNHNLSYNDNPFLLKNFLEYPEYYLSWETVTDCLYRRDLYWEIIGNAGWKENIPLEETVCYGTYQNPTYILNSVNRGRGFVITQYGRYNELTNSLCRDVESNFYCCPDIHIYGGLKGSGSFNIHCDPTVNFIIQVEGVTNWKVFKNRCSPISSIDPVFPDEKNLEIAIETDLSPGDLLYIPNNCYHKASPEGKRLSMSIAMLPKTFNTPTIDRNPLKINYGKQI